jgi:hypothetical protein
VLAVIIGGIVSVHVIADDATHNPVALDPGAHRLILMVMGIADGTAVAVEAVASYPVARQLLVQLLLSLHLHQLQRRHDPEMELAMVIWIAGDVDMHCDARLPAELKHVHHHIFVLIAWHETAYMRYASLATSITSILFGVWKY